jgi:hypothetical protein
VSLAAEAGDSDGTVARVDFYAGTTLLGSSTTAPFAHTWSNVPAGSYSLTARAIDDEGATTTSAAVAITVTDPEPVNVAPTVTLTAPAAGATSTAPATVSLAAEAADSDGTVVRVDFYAGTTLLGSSTTAPFAHTWSNVPAGSYSLTARAVDDDGATATSAAVAITVTDPEPVNVAPTVTLTAPANGATLTAPASVALTAEAADSDGTVVRVDFYAGTTLLGSSTTAPFAHTWSNVPAGSYSLTARAVDDDGAATTSAAVAVEVTPAASIPADVVLYAASATLIDGAWQVVQDATAAGGSRLQNPDARRAKRSSPQPAADYFELAFEAEAGRPYRLWIRGKAEKNSYANDSVFVQFDGSTDASGAAVSRIGTSSASIVALEDCGGCGVQDWGWADNGYGAGVLGPLVYFERTGPQRIRIQAREDGLGLDQVVLSSSAYLSIAPGAPTNDATILPATGGTGNAAPTVVLVAPNAGSRFTAPATIVMSANASDADGYVERVDFYASGALVCTATTAPFECTWPDVPPGGYSLSARATDDEGSTAVSPLVGIEVEDPAAPPTLDEVVLYASTASRFGAWTVVADATAAGGARLQNPDSGAPKRNSALAAPADYFELTFDAEAGTPYRLWIRGRAQGDSYTNDSVFVQFDGSTNSAGDPVDRIGTTSASIVVLEDCGGCGVQGWGWQDTGYGTNVLGPVVYFASPGRQRVRFQVREDGLAIDQVVLSAVRFLTQPPGGTKNDATILPAR